MSEFSSDSGEDSSIDEEFVPANYREHNDTMIVNR